MKGPPYMDELDSFEADDDMSAAKSTTTPSTNQDCMDLERMQMIRLSDIAGNCFVRSGS